MRFNENPLPDSWIPRQIRLKTDIALIVSRFVQYRLSGAI